MILEAEPLSYDINAHQQLFSQWIFLTVLPGAKRVVGETPEGCVPGMVSNRAWNTGVYFQLEKIRCGNRGQARAPAG